MPRPARRRSGPPRGRDAVMEAICEAAAELFAERGPARVSGREIAARAGVNYGLIHRHFGGMDALRRTVMTRLARDLGESLARASETGKGYLEILAEHDHHWRSLARAALDGEDLGAIQDEYPVIANVLEHIASGDEHEPGAEKRVAVATVAAALLGWSVFETFLRQAAGLTKVSDAEIATHLDAALTRIFQSPA